MKRKYLGTLVVIGLFGIFFSITDRADDIDPDLAAYGQTESNPFFSYDVNPNPLMQQIAAETKDAFDQAMAELPIPSFNFPSLDGDAQDPTNSLIAVSIFPVLSAKTKAMQFALAMPGSQVKSGRRKPSDPYAETKDLYGIKLTADVKPFHLKSLDGKDLGSGKQLSFKPNKHGFDYVLDNKSYKFNGLTLIPDSDQLTHVQWRTIAGNRFFDYRGSFMLTPEMTPGDQLCVRVVNFLNIERYVSEVLPGEMDAKFPAAALQAQAVAARTYAYNKIIQSRALHRSFDLTAGTQDQLYMGASRETDAAELAVQNTLGKVLVCETKICLAMFAGNDGGRTVAFADYDPAHRNIPYLVSISELDVAALRRIKNSGTFEHEIEGALFAQAIRDAGLYFPDPSVLATVVEGKNTSQRATALRVYGKTTNVLIKGNALLAIEKTVRIHPFMDNGRLKGNKILVRSYGSGHGVGMCQEGARILASEFRYDFEAILKFYYKGARIVDFDPTLAPTTDFNL